MPVERQRLRLGLGTDGGELLAVDSDAVPQVVTIRPDLTGASLPSVVRPLVDAAPAVALVPVSGAPRRLLVTATVALDQIGEFVVDPITGVEAFDPIDPTTLSPTPVTTTVYVRDGRGLIHRFAGEPAALAADPLQIVVPLAAGTTEAQEAVIGVGATLSYPLEVMGVDLVISLPARGSATAGRIGLAAISASDAPEGDDWRGLDLAAGGEWQLGWSQGPGTTINVVPSAAAANRSMDLGGDGPFGALPGIDQNGHGVTVSFVPDQIAMLEDAELAAVVNQPFLNETSAELGDHVTLDLEGGQRDVRIVGAVRSFPATEPYRPLAIVDLASLGLLRFQAAHATRAPSEWWLNADDTAAAAAVVPSSSGPFAGAMVVSRLDRIASLSADPLALGIIGALALGFVVAGLFAVIGLAASAAVSARQRRGEFALLRALGLSGGQLSGWLWLENASLVLISLLAGTGLGLLIGWVVLPYITVTQEATTPFPPVIVQTPWATILILEAVTAAALAITVVALARVLRRAGVGSVLRMGGE
jgi:hypothetical protein